MYLALTALLVGYASAEARPAPTFAISPEASATQSNWVDEFLACLEAILLFLGGQASLNEASPEQGMAIVQGEYAKSGVPDDLTYSERVALHSSASDALDMLKTAPSDVSSAQIASFRTTLRDIMFETSPWPGTP